MAGGANALIKIYVGLIHGYWARTARSKYAIRWFGRWSIGTAYRSSGMSQRPWLQTCRAAVLWLARWGLLHAAGLLAADTITGLRGTDKPALGADSMLVGIYEVTTGNWLVNEMLCVLLTMSWKKLPYRP